MNDFRRLVLGCIKTKINEKKLTCGTINNFEDLKKKKEKRKRRKKENKRKNQIVRDNNYHTCLPTIRLLEENQNQCHLWKFY